MTSKIWLNFLLWGLGHRLEKRNDYKTDILLVLNLMTWYSLFVLAPSAGGLVYWVFALLNPASSIVVQLIVGYLLVRGVRREAGPRMVKSTAKEQVRTSPSEPMESEEP